MLDLLAGLDTHSKSAQADLLHVLGLRADLELVDRPRLAITFNREIGELAAGEEAWQQSA